MAGMGLWRFAIWTFAGSAIWNTVLAAAGVYLGTRFGELERYIGPVSVGIVVAIVVLYVWRMATWKPRGEAS